MVSQLGNSITLRMMCGFVYFTYVFFSYFLITKASFDLHCALLFTVFF